LAGCGGSLGTDLPENFFPHPENPFRLSGPRKNFPGGNAVRGLLARAKQIQWAPGRTAGPTPESNVSTPLVSFSIREAYLPSPPELLLALHGDGILQGRIVDYSDGGSGGTTYAVVAVEGLEQPVIVPVEKLRTNCE
jgi:hypothetical protein